MDDTIVLVITKHIFFQLDYWKVPWTTTEPHPFPDAEEDNSPVLR